VHSSTPAMNDLDYILQDNQKKYWIGSNGQGLYVYDGKKIQNYTKEKGLCNNFVLGIEKDINGGIWLITRDGICFFNGKSFIDYSDSIKKAPWGMPKLTQGGICLPVFDGVCYYDGKNFVKFAIHPYNYTPPFNSMNRPYSIYCTFTDKSGNIWFGTQEKGVCRYDGKEFVFFNKYGLDAAAVRCIYQDNKGTMWFGNNGAGLFSYDGKELKNITTMQGLENKDFLEKKIVKDTLGTMSRVWSINQDKNNNLWIATIDAGLWRYDGKKFVNYHQGNGLPGNSISKIFRNDKQELWFIVNGKYLYTLNGQKFVPLNLFK
jgi:ligand-binding sensor domain-containing protein